MPDFAMPIGAGSFCWNQLNTTDLGKAQSFYGPLFGWSLRQESFGPMPLAVAHAGAREVGSLMQIPAEAGGRSQWMDYVQVESAAESFAKAQSLGGQPFVPPTEVPGVGTFAVLGDPGGSLFALFQQPEGHDPARPMPVGPGTFCWHELATREAEACLAFYTALFGWTTEAKDMGPMGTYHLLLRDGQQVGGLMPMVGPMWEGIPNHWLPYLAAEDVDASFAKAAALGGQGLVKPNDIPGIGRFAIVQDPTGGVFALFRGM